MISLTNQHDLFKLWIALACVGWLVSVVVLVVMGRAAWQLRRDGPEGLMVRANLVRECVILVKQSGYLWISYEIATHFSRVHLVINPAPVAIVFTLILFLAPGGLLFYSLHSLITRYRLRRALRRDLERYGGS